MKLSRIPGTASIWIVLYVIEYHGSLAYENITTFRHDAVIDILKRLNWSSVAIIQDTDKELTLPEYVQHIRYNIQRFPVPEILNIVHEVMFPEINIIVLLETNVLPLVLKHINDHDILSGGVTDFRHHSKILVCVASLQEVKNIENRVQSLENVAVIACDHQRINSHTDILTLHNHPNGMGFSNVADLNIFNFNVSTIFPNTQYGYNNRHLIVSTLPSTVFCLKSKDNGTVAYDGYVFDIWRSIAAVLNFSYTIKEPEDGNWGVETENGTWTGFVEQLRKREVDVVLSDLTVTFARAQHVDYIYPPIRVEASDIVYKRKFTNSNAFVKILKPLKPSVYFVVTAVLVGMLIVYILVEQRRYIKRVFCEGLLAAFVKHVPDVGWDILGSALKQGFHVYTMPKTNAGKILLASWCLLVLLITAVYSANLIASLSNATSTNKISSIEELVASDYMFGVFNGALAYVSIQTSPRPEIQMLYQKMLKLNETNEDIFGLNSAELIERAKEGDFAVAVYQSEGEALRRQNCLLDLVGETVNWAAEELAFAVIKNSPLKSDIEYLMTNLQEGGMLHIWWKKWNPNGAGCEIEKRVQPISLGDIGGGFLIVCCGLILSVCVLVMEILYRSTHRVSSRMHRVTK